MNNQDSDIGTKDISPYNVLNPELRRRHQREKITYVELPHYHYLALMNFPGSLVLDIIEM